MTEMAEASMNFDSRRVRPFLERISPLVTGFEEAEIARVLRVVEELSIDEESELVFAVLYEQKPISLRIRIFKDDVDAPDLYFFTVPPLADKIQQSMRTFSEEHGI